MKNLLWIVILLLPGFTGKSQGILINELAASVSNSQVDNYGEYEDWIEIYNGSGSDVNLAGWYISDNHEKPFKFRIPDSNSDLTTVLSKSFLILWADKDTLQGPNHLNFSLKKKGENLFLYRPGKDGPVLADSVRYRKLLVDRSYGRCQEPSNEWVVFKHPTPGKPNVCLPEKQK